LAAISSDVLGLLNAGLLRSALFAPGARLLGGSLSRHFAVHCPVHKVRWKVIGVDVADNEVLVAEA
jgi:hypothetical protein